MAGLRLIVFAGVWCLVAWGAVTLARATCDLAQPVLGDFDFSPKAVDVSSAPQPVTCTMSFSDDVSGIEEATCTFISPTFLQTRACTAEAPSSGDRLDGTFTCEVEFPQGVDNGVWTVNNVSATDGVGRLRSVVSVELQQQGYPTELSVTSPAPDLSGPQLDGFDFAPKSVNVTTSAQEVSCTMDWSDAGSGVEFAQCSFTAPGTDQAQGCSAFAPSSGTPNDGTYECSVTIPRYAADGTWEASAFALDSIGNSNGLDPDGLGAAGFPTDLQVTSDADVSGPVLDGFDIDPTSIDVSSSEDVVSCTMTVSDAPAGVQRASCEIGRLDGFDFLAHDCTASAPASGTRQDGVFRCNVVVPASSSGGTWQVQSVSLIDEVGNPTDLTTADLTASGFPTDVDVTCEGGAGEPETTLSWADERTLTWDPIPDAVEYNAYRGDLSDLVDADGDGLPDPGYGACRNSSDPDTTDTQLVDEEVPSAADGFFYLVGYDTASASDLGLGTSSAGIDRSPASPCP